MLRLQNQFTETTANMYFRHGVFLDYHERGRNAAVKYPKTADQYWFNVYVCETDNVWNSTDPHYITENLPGVGLYSNRNIKKIWHS